MLHQSITPEPAPAAIPALAHGWTPALKATFLDHLASKGNVRASCARVGLSTESAYRLRRRDGDFARGWAAALALAREASVQVLADRAIDGVEEKVFYRGELIDTRRRYDARLLLAHIARLDRLVDEQAAGPDTARFDELLARIAGEEGPAIGADDERLLPCDRQSFEGDAVQAAKDRVEQAWIDAAGGEAPELDEEEYAVFLAEFEAAAEHARSEARAHWDEWIVRACSTVDALADRSDEPPPQGWPAHQAPASAYAESPAPQACVSSPRTLSTVSTAALARGIAGPATVLVPPFIPPFAAADRTHSGPRA